MKYNTNELLEKIIKATVNGSIHWTTLTQLLMSSDDPDALVEASRALKRYSKVMGIQPHKYCYVTFCDDALLLFSHMGNNYMLIADNGEEPELDTYTLLNRQSIERLYNAIRYTINDNDTDAALHIIESIMVH